MRSAAGSPERSAPGPPPSTALGRCDRAGRAAPPAGRPAAADASDHDTSAGRIRVATAPGGPAAAATASTASAPTSRSKRRCGTTTETVRATVSMSDWSGASKRRW